MPIVIQDPSVLGATDWQAAATHPSGATCESGFSDGPACERVAIVDIDAVTGTLRNPARVIADGGVYRNTGSYEVEAPATGGRRLVWQSRTQTYSQLDRLMEGNYLDDPFMKVSVFGTVVRTIGFLESAVGLARRMNWAFGREQLLVVPAAGERENAFYDRESGSLRFFYFPAGGDEGWRIYTALSQDVVVHETAHAVIDAAAPDLYHAVTPDSLAIHEAVADITAALVSVLNREFRGGKPRERVAAFIKDLSSSSRYSRFAEQFGTRTRGLATLRELLNDRRLGDDLVDPDIVDIASPHSLSETLSGSLFSVLRQSVLQSDEYGPQLPFQVHDKGGRHGLGVTTAGRIASLALKGLDWLPPGDVSLGDYGRAILAADRFHLPDSTGQRELLIAELDRRGIARAADLRDAADMDSLGPIDFGELSSSRWKARAFVRQHRELFGIPKGVAFDRPQVRLHRTRHREIRGWCNGDTIANLDRPVAPVTIDDAELMIIKVAWWTVEPNPLGRGYGKAREVKVGTTLAVDAGGAVQALLRGGQEPELMRRRDAFLAGLARSGVLLTPNQSVGPDGERLSGYVHAVPHSGGTRFSGGLRALHLVEEVP